MAAQNKGSFKEGHMLSLFWMGKYCTTRQPRLKDYSLVEGSILWFCDSDSGKVKRKLYRYMVHSRHISFIVLSSSQPLNYF